MACTMVTTTISSPRTRTRRRPSCAARWRAGGDYLRNPAPANKLIKIDNPKMTDDRIAFAIAKMKEMHVLDRGEAATKGIGTMTEARWQQTRDFLVKADLLKPTVDWKKAFTTRFTDGLKILT